MTFIAAHWLWLLPVVALLFIAFTRHAGQAEQRFIIRHPLLAARSTNSFANTARPWPLWLYLGALACLVIALAYPASKTQTAAASPEGRSILLLIDASPSMAVQDFPDPDNPDDAGNPGRMERMAALQQAVLNFIEQRPQDRLGVITVTDHAGLLLPLTHDHHALSFWIEQIRPGVDGQATVLGDGMTLAIEHITQRTERGGPPPLLISWTDGLDNSGVLTSGEGAGLAQAEGIRVYNVNFAPSGVTPPPGYPTLDEIAELTGGAVLQADELDDLHAITDAIAEREQINRTQPIQYAWQGHWHWPFALALLLLAAGFYQQQRGG